MEIKEKDQIPLQRVIHNIKQITFFGGGNLLAQIIMMAYTIILARILGPSLLGIYSGLYAIFGVSITFVNFGLDLWFLSNAHEYKSIRLLNGDVIQGKLFLGIFLAAISLLLLPMAQPDSFKRLFVFLVFCDVMGEAILKSFLSVFNIQKKIKTLNFFLLLSRGGKLFLLLLLFFLNQASLLNTFISRAVVTIIILLFCAQVIKPTFIRVPLGKLFRIFRNTAAFGFSEILAMVYGNIDVAMLSLFSISKTGIYSPANSIIHAINIIPNSLLQFTLPRYATKKSQDRNERKEFLIKTLFGFGFVGLLLSIGLFFYSKLIISIFLGEKFIETISLLRILSPILFFKSLSFGFVLIIILSDMQKKRIFPQFIVAIGNILFNILLIPFFGVTAVAWVYLISEILLTLGYGLIVIKSSNYVVNLSVKS